MDECINYFELNVLINNHRMQIKSLKQGIPQQEFITPPLPHSKSKKETCDVKYTQSVFLFFGSWILEVLITKLLKLASQGSGTSEKEATEKYSGSLCKVNWKTAWKLALGDSGRIPGFRDGPWKNWSVSFSWGNLYP